MSKLEARVQGVVKALKEIDARLRTIEERERASVERPVEAPRDLAKTLTPTSAEAPPARPQGREVSVVSQEHQLAHEISFSQILPLAGQTCLILCGALLLRALTDMNVLPVQVGFSLGLLYAAGALLLTEFAARAGRLLAASFYGTSAIVIAYPLVWEAATGSKFGFLSGEAAAFALGMASVLTLGVAWRRELRALAWLTATPALVAALGLFVATHSVGAFTVLLLVVGGITAWLAYDRMWGGIRWPAAIAVDLAVLQLTIWVSRSGGPPEAYGPISASLVVALSLALPFVYLSSFAVQTLLRKHDVGLFELLQAAAVLVVGFGGAVRVAQSAGTGTTLLGAGALVLAIASYAVSFAFRELRWEHRRNFMFYAWLALALTLTGALLLTHGWALRVLLCGLSVSAALLGARFRRVVLFYHSAVYIVASAIEAGLFPCALEALTASVSHPWTALTLPCVVVLAAAVFSYLVLAGAEVDAKRSWSSRIPKAGVASVALIGCAAAVLVAMLRMLGHTPPDSDPALVATLRTAVLATSAVVLSIVSRSGRLLELRWFVYPLLVGGGIKLFIEDLPHGRAVTLFVAFAFYGIALILSSHFIRTAESEKDLKS